MAIYPPLRNVEATPVEHEGEQLVCIYDAEGYVDARILLSPPAFFVATCLDGQQDETAIQGAFAAQFGGAHIDPEDIERIATMLEEQGFLYSPQFLAMIKAQETAFKASPHGQPIWRDDPIRLTPLNCAR